MISLRHEKILKIIKENSVETQEELSKLLQNEGFDVTQATVSRDIKKLKLVKVQTQDGSKYVASADAVSKVQTKFKSFLNECEAKFDYAQNMVVVKCLPGMAQSICAMLDKQDFEVEIVGTIAGDDTVFIVTRSEAEAERLCDLYR